ncbi:MAG: hypothetical protein ACREOK_14280 [Gemmatimonadaceae bacterium]
MIPVQQRRWIARAVKLGLVGLAVVVVMAWVAGKRSRPNVDIRIESRGEGRSNARVSTGPMPEVGMLAPGDAVIFNQDSSVNLILRGDQLLAGLSPQMREKIQREIVQSTSDETTGFGAAVANVVRTTVASAIGTHAVYSLRDIRAIDVEDGQIVLVQNNGRRVELLGDVNSDDEEISRTFSPEDAQRFVDAVGARMRELRRSR